MVSLFPLETESHCHDVHCVVSLPYFSIHHSVAPHNMQYSPFHLPVTSLGTSPFPSPWVTIFGRRTIGPEIRRISGCLYLYFWNFSANIKNRLLTCSKPLKFHFLYIFPCWPGIKSVVHSGTQSRVSPFSLISTSALFAITLIFFALICSPASVLCFISSFVISCSFPLYLAKRTLS